jgi:hypothetical protein
VQVCGSFVRWIGCFLANLEKVWETFAILDLGSDRVKQNKKKTKKKQNNRFSSIETGVMCKPFLPTDHAVITQMQILVLFWLQLTFSEYWVQVEIYVMHLC